MATIIERIVERIMRPVTQAAAEIAAGVDSDVRNENVASSIVAARHESIRAKAAQREARAYGVSIR